MKKRRMVLVALIFPLIACEQASFAPHGKSENPPAPRVIVEKEDIGKEQPLPPGVKIKLKKDGKESYSWELTGSDADQILKVNEKLRRQLGEKASR